MIPRIKTIKPLDQFRLYVVFDDEKRVIYDVSEDIESIADFRILRMDPDLFHHVQVDESRTCVFWNDRVDLASDSIYEYGRTVYE